MTPSPNSCPMNGEGFKTITAGLRLTISGGIKPLKSQITMAPCLGFQSYCSFRLFHHFFYGVSYVVVGRAIRAATLLMSMALAFLPEICGVWWVKRRPMLLRSLMQLRCFSSLFDPVGRVLSDTPGYPVTAGHMGRLVLLCPRPQRFSGGNP